MQPIIINTGTKKSGGTFILLLIIMVCCCCFYCCYSICGGILGISHIATDNTLNCPIPDLDSTDVSTVQGEITSRLAELSPITTQKDRVFQNMINGFNTSCTHASNMNHWHPLALSNWDPNSSELACSAYNTETTCQQHGRTSDDSIDVCTYNDPEKSTQCKIINSLNKLGINQIKDCDMCYGMDDDSTIVKCLKLDSCKPKTDSDAIKCSLFQGFNIFAPTPTEQICRDLTYSDCSVQPLCTWNTERNRCESDGDTQIPSRPVWWNSSEDFNAEVNKANDWQRVTCPSSHCIYTPSDLMNLAAATCTAPDSVSAETAAACAAVSDLSTSTECETAADGACTYKSAKYSMAKKIVLAIQPAAGDESVDPALLEGNIPSSSDIEYDSLKSTMCTIKKYLKKI